MQKDTDMDPDPITFTGKQKQKSKTNNHVGSSELFIIATISFPDPFFPALFVRAVAT